jgi:hypothetical protein
LQSSTPVPSSAGGAPTTVTYTLTPASSQSSSSKQIQTFSTRPKPEYVIATSQATARADYYQI